MHSACSAVVEGWEEQPRAAPSLSVQSNGPPRPRPRLRPAAVYREVPFSISKLTKEIFVGHLTSYVECTLNFGTFMIWRVC